MEHWESDAVENNPHTEEGQPQPVQESKLKKIADGRAQKVLKRIESVRLDGDAPTMTHQEQMQFLHNFNTAIEHNETTFIGGRDSWFDAWDWSEASVVIVHAPEALAVFKDSSIGYLDLLGYLRFMRFAGKDDIEKIKELYAQFGKEIFVIMGLLNYFPAITPEQLAALIYQHRHEDIAAVIQYCSQGLQKIYSLIKNSSDLFDTIKDDRSKFNEIVDMVRKNSDVLEPIAHAMFGALIEFLQEGKGSPQEYFATINEKLSLMTSITGTYKQAGMPLALEKIEGVEVLELTGEDISEDSYLGKRMIEIITKNYEHDPILSKELPALLRSKFGDPNVKFVVSTYEGEVAAFCRLEEQGDGLYWGSLNVDPQSKSADIGTMMLDYIMEQTYPDMRLEAHATPHIPALSLYLVKGFVVTGVGAIGEKPQFSMVRDPQLLKILKEQEVRETRLVASRDEILDQSEELLTQGLVIAAIEKREEGFEIQFKQNN